MSLVAKGAKVGGLVVDILPLDTDCQADLQRRRAQPLDNLSARIPDSWVSWNLTARPRRADPGTEPTGVEKSGTYLPVRSTTNGP